MVRHTFGSTVLLLALLCAASALGETVNVEVKADTIYEINGVDEIQIAEVAVPREVFAAILTGLRHWARKARAAPVPAVT